MFCNSEKLVYWMASWSDPRTIFLFSLGQQNRHCPEIWVCWLGLVRRVVLFAACLFLALSLFLYLFIFFERQILALWFLYLFTCIQWLNHQTVRYGFASIVVLIQTLTCLFFKLNPHVLLKGRDDTQEINNTFIFFTDDSFVCGSIYKKNVWFWSLTELPPAEPSHPI